MPRGAKPGERRGGRAKGKPNRFSMRAALRAERDQDQARAEGRPIAKDVLDNLMSVFMNIATKYAPKKDDVPPMTDPVAITAWDKRVKEFERWALHAKDTAKALAAYQSPTYRAIAIAPLTDKNVVDDGRVMLHTIEEVRRELMDYGVPPDQFAKALMGPPTIEHDPKEKSKVKKTRSSTVEPAAGSTPAGSTKAGAVLFCEICRSNTLHVDGVCDLSDMHKVSAA
jgi:hypothetical protein